MSIYDKASLVLIPSGTKTSKVYSQKPTNGDGDFTFSRSTAATRVNASGNIEKETQNFLPYSNTFNTGWSPINGTLSQGVSDPFGGNMAWSWTATNTDPYMYSQTAWSGVFTLSIWAKGVGSSIGKDFEFRMGGVLQSFTLTSDWQRFELFVSGSASSIGFEVGNPAVAGDVVHIYGAQLEQGLVARDYIETTTPVYGGITDNVPRLDYTDSSCPALLLEPQRTNVVTNSEHYSAASWQNVGATITDNNTTSPEGKQNATLLVGTAGSAARIQDYFGALSGVHTYSLFIKSTGVATRLNLQTNDVGGATFSVPASGAPTLYAEGTNVGDPFIEDYGSGWYRVGFSFTPSGGGVNNYFQIYPDSSSNVSSIYAFGAQVEAGSYATSYIPTYGSAVTRAYENQDATGLSTSVFNNDDLTLFYDFDYNANGREGSTTAYRIFSGSSQLGIKGRSGSSRSVEIYSSGSFSGSIVFNNIANSSRIKVALRITNGTCELFFNGAKDTETIDVSGAAPYTWGQITMLASSSLNTSLNQCLGFPTALTDQELIDLTTL